jgi:hypothetical protein
MLNMIGVKVNITQFPIGVAVSSLSLTTPNTCVSCGMIMTVQKRPELEFLNNLGGLGNE